MNQGKYDHATPLMDCVLSASLRVAAPSAGMLREVYSIDHNRRWGRNPHLACLANDQELQVCDQSREACVAKFIRREGAGGGKRSMRGSSGSAARFFWIVMAVLALLATATGVRADDKKTVQSGAAVVIVPPSEKVIEDKSGPLKGTVRIIDQATTPKTYSLIYLAPKTTVDFTDAVKYSDGTDHTVLVSVAAGAEPPTLISPDIYSQSFKALFVLFIIATILESGLAVIFNWRPFIQLFDARGVKTIISFVFAWLFVIAFDLDIVTHLVNVYSGKAHPSGFPGTFITALVLAGGSSGVNNLLVALGFRSVRTAEQTAPKPPATEAWISVRLIRVDAKGPVDVLIGPEDAALSVAGTITGSSRSSAIYRFFLRDFGRFPTAGGFAVTPTAQPYKVKLAGLDSNGNPIFSREWGPYQLAPKAIVDIELKL